MGTLLTIPRSALARTRSGVSKIDKLWAMEVFVRVAECGSFSRAAESLDLANATVTTCVRNLEKHLNVTLINRDTRRLRLTEEGQLYLPQARALLESVQRTEDEVRAWQGELRGTLHMEAPISIGQTLVCPALTGFARRYPQLQTAITLTNQPHHLIERGIDIAVRQDHIEDADLVARPLYEARYAVCCTPDLAARLPAHPAQLDATVCLGILAEERRHANPWVFTRDSERVQLQPAGPLHFNSSHDLLGAARAGLGVAHVLDIFANRMLASGELVELYGDWTTGSKTFYVVTAKARVGSAKVRALTEYLMEVFDSERRPSAKRAVAVKALGKR